MNCGGGAQLRDLLLKSFEPGRALLGEQRFAQPACRHLELELADAHAHTLLLSHERHGIGRHRQAVAIGHDRLAGGLGLKQ